MFNRIQSKYFYFINCSNKGKKISRNHRGFKLSLVTETLIVKNVLCTSLVFTEVAAIPRHETAGPKVHRSCPQNLARVWSYRRYPMIWKQATQIWALPVVLWSTIPPSLPLFFFSLLERHINIVLISFIGNTYAWLVLTYLGYLA